MARAGGRISGDARRNIEAQTGKPAITADNARKLGEIVAGVIETVAGADEVVTTDKETKHS